MAEDRLKCIDAGCTDYLPKPLTRSQLLRMAARFLPPGMAPASVEAEESPSPAKVVRSATSGDVIRSEMASETKLQKLLDRFIERLPERIATIQSLLDGQDLGALRQAVHQLKGAGGGYGFPRITGVRCRGGGTNQIVG